MERKALLICLLCVVILVIANAAALCWLYLPDQAAAVASGSVEAGEVPSVEPVMEEQAAPASVAEEAAPEVPDTVPAAPAKVSEPARAVTVKVPEGPFQVRNSATGKMNTLSQNDDYSITLKDETGASQWVMPFSGDICGRVSTVDFYANGKLQFLFCSGRKLCLVDRLGRMVSGFPVVLAKDVLLGPDVYDFNSARRYNIMVLNKDNTIDMYNLKGEKPQKWTTIAPAAQVVSMPEYLELGAKSYWCVKTADGKTQVYSFYGNPVKAFTGEVNKNELY